MILRLIILLLVCFMPQQEIIGKDNKTKTKHTKIVSKKKRSQQQKPQAEEEEIESNNILEPYGIEVNSSHALLVEYETGKVLLAKNATEPLEPASMTKIMTAYLIMKALKEGKVQPTDMAITSRYAFSMEGSRMFLEVGQSASIIDLLKGLIIVSGNDAAVVLAEFLGGTESAFAADMTRIAKEIGCKNTSFKNASGLPQGGHYTTPQDLITISMRIFQNFPEYYSIHKEERFAFNNTNQENRNPLLRKNIGCDGVKTGHAEKPGYGMVASAEQKGRRLFLVCAGLKSMKQRAEESYRLLQWGFQIFNNYLITPPHQEIVKVPVRYGTEDFVALEAAPHTLTLQRNKIDQLKVTIRYQAFLQAPIKDKQQVGEIVVSHPDWSVPEIIPLVVSQDVNRAFFLKRIGQTIAYCVTK